MIFPRVLTVPRPSSQKANAAKSAHQVSSTDSLIAELARSVTYSETENCNPDQLNI